MGRESPLEGVAHLPLAPPVIRSTGATELGLECPPVFRRTSLGNHFDSKVPELKGPSNAVHRPRHRFSNSVFPVSSSLFYEDLFCVLVLHIRSVIVVDEKLGRALVGFLSNWGLRCAFIRRSLLCDDGARGDRDPVARTSDLSSQMPVPSHIPALIFKASTISPRPHLNSRTVGGESLQTKAFGSDEVSTPVMTPVGSDVRVDVVGDDFIDSRTSVPLDSITVPLESIVIYERCVRSLLRPRDIGDVSSGVSSGVGNFSYVGSVFSDGDGMDACKYQNSAENRGTVLLEALFTALYLAQCMPSEAISSRGDDSRGSSSSSSSSSSSGSSSGNGFDRSLVVNQGTLLPTKQRPNCDYFYHASRLLDLAIGEGVLGSTVVQPLLAPIWENAGATEARTRGLGRVGVCAGAMFPGFSAVSVNSENEYKAALGALCVLFGHLDGALRVSESWLCSLYRHLSEQEDPDMFFSNALQSDLSVSCSFEDVLCACMRIALASLLCADAQTEETSFIGESDSYPSDSRTTQSDVFHCPSQIDLKASTRTDRGYTDGETCNICGLVSLDSSIDSSIVYSSYMSSLCVFATSVKFLFLLYSAKALISSELITQAKGEMQRAFVNSDAHATLGMKIESHIQAVLVHGGNEKKGVTQEFQWDRVVLFELVAFAIGRDNALLVSAHSLVLSSGLEGSSIGCVAQK